jgi:hypothetical protein
MCVFLVIYAKFDATNFPREWKLYGTKKNENLWKKNGPMVKFWAL